MSASAAPPTYPLQTLADSERDSDMARDENAVSEIETDPLLVRDSEGDVVLVQPTPLPKVQLGAIFAIKLMLPVATTQTLPYLNKLVEELASADGANTGYYSGLVGTASSLAHLLTIYMWARASDRIGRVPVIVAGTTGIAIFTLLFGLSRSFGVLLVTRFLVGVFSGTTGAIHSVVGELTDETNQSTAFPIYDIVSAVGFTIGPLIGGTFANPADYWPSWFVGSFWKRYPYFLPCLVTAGLAVGALFLAILVLEETLPTKRRLKIPTDVPPFEDPAIPTADADAVEYIDTARSDPLSIKSLLAIPILRHIYASSAALGFLGNCFTTVIVLLAYTPIEKGGLSFSPRAIGKAISAMGFVSIFLKLTLPALLRRFGVLTVFRSCLQAWPVTFASMALLSIIARSTTDAQGAALVWTALGFTLFLSRLGTMAFSLVMILTKDHTPGTTSLGTSNGAAEFAQSSASSLGPVVVSSLFAFSVSNNVLGGYLWVVVMVLVTLLSGSFAERIRKYRGDK